MKIKKFNENWVTSGIKKIGKKLNDLNPYNIDDEEETIEEPIEDGPVTEPVELTPEEMKKKHEFDEILTDIHSRLNNNGDLVKNAKTDRYMDKGLITDFISLKDGVNIQIDHFFEEGYYDVSIELFPMDDPLEQRIYEIDKEIIHKIWDITTIANMYMDDLKEKIMKRIKTFESFQVNENEEDLYTKIRKVIQNTITSPSGFYYLEGIEDAVVEIVDIAFEEGFGEQDLWNPDQISDILNDTLKKDDKDGYLINGKDEATAKIVSLLTGEEIDERPNAFNDITDLKPGAILPPEPEDIVASIRKNNLENQPRYDHFGEINRQRDRGTDSRNW